MGGWGALHARQSRPEHGHLNSPQMRSQGVGRGYGGATNQLAPIHSPVGCHGVDSPFWTSFPFSRQPPFLSTFWVGSPGCRAPPSQVSAERWMEKTRSIPLRADSARRTTVQRTTAHQRRPSGQRRREALKELRRRAPPAMLECASRLTKPTTCQLLGTNVQEICGTMTPQPPPEKTRLPSRSKGERLLALCLSSEGTDPQGIG